MLLFYHCQVENWVLSNQVGFREGLIDDLLAAGDLATRSVFGNQLLQIANLQLDRVRHHSFQRESGIRIDSFQLESEKVHSLGNTSGTNHCTLGTFIQYFVDRNTL